MLKLCVRQSLALARGLEFKQGAVRGVATGRVFPVLKSELEIEQFVVNSSWRAQDILEAGDVNEAKEAKEANEAKETVDEAMLEGLMKLSGLSIRAVDKEALQRLLVSLEAQLRFTGKLQSLDPAGVMEEEAEVGSRDVAGSTGITRLVGDRQAKELGFRELMAEIQERQEPSAGKGETAASWDPLELSQERDEDNYFVVNEGLLKKSKLGL
ncbi:unnamed protein product [[Candida] boidinii]|uniref:Unnamed protein product n=1 Tax=Candida boidinii TaxID=5477 RepID=A0A9W6WB15_CANBO|nr:unnamed protein product [[Candida] boidinii]GMG15592.1 unnamed protein product [[Candida] boidinii]